MHSNLCLSLQKRFIQTNSLPGSVPSAVCVRRDHRGIVSSRFSLFPSSSLLHLSADACCACCASDECPQSCLPRLPSLEVRTAGWRQGEVCDVTWMRSRLSHLSGGREHEMRRGAYVEVGISSLKGRLEMKKHPVSGTKPCLGCGVWSPGGAGGGAAQGYFRSDGSSLRGRENKSSVSEKCILPETVSSFCAESVFLFHFTSGFKLQEQHRMSLPALCHLPWCVRGVLRL